MRNPEISTSQLLVIRSLFSGVVILMLMNVKTKDIMWDSIPKQQVPALATRIIQGIFNMYCAYLSIKYFPLVFVSLITNIAPLILAVFAYLIYKEKLSALDIVNLLVSFLGVAILLTGTLDETPQSPSTSASLSELIIPAILLVAIPFNQCSLQLLLKSMRSLNELSISAWMTLFMLLFFIPLNYLTKPDNASSPFFFLSDFDLGSWLISALFGLTGVYSQTTRAKALHYEDSAKLGVLLYF